MEPYDDDGRLAFYAGDCRAVLEQLPAAGVQTCVTSPPYVGLRDYGGHPLEIGREASVGEYVAHLLEALGAVRRVLRDDGTLWLNLGDGYGPDKQLRGVPWRVAFALQDVGWYLRSDIIWHKPNPMPCPVADRPTPAHEYLFLLTKQRGYYYDGQAIQEWARFGTHHARYQGTYTRHKVEAVQAAGAQQFQEGLRRAAVNPLTRNKRSVWTVATEPYEGAHFATFPPALVAPCVLAGSRPGDLVLDPFCGSGSTGVAALANGRRFQGVDLNEGYLELAARRLTGALAPVGAPRVGGEQLGLPLALGCDT